MRNLNNNLNLTKTFMFIHYILKSQTTSCDNVTGTMTSKDSLEVEQSFYYFNDKDERVASLALLSDRIEFSEVNEVEEQYTTLFSDTAETEIKDEGYNNKLRQGIKEIVDKMTQEEKKFYNNFKHWGKVGDEPKHETLPLNVTLAKYNDEPNEIIEKCVYCGNERSSVIKRPEYDNDLLCHPCTVYISSYENNPNPFHGDGNGGIAIRYLENKNMTMAQLKDKLEKAGIKFIPSKKSY